MNEPLGRVAYPGGEVVATLHADGSWSVPGREWSEPLLRLAYSDRYGGPAEGPFGPSALRRLAEDVGGTATIVDRPGPPPGTIY